MFSRPRAERNTSLLAQKILVSRHTGDSWCCTSTSDNNKNSAAFFMPKNIAVGQNKCWRRMFLQTVQNTCWICFNTGYNCMIRFHCSEPGSGGVVQSGDRLPSERPLFKTMFQDVWACYHWCFIFDLLRPTCLFTSGEEHFVNLLQAQLVWMVRLSLCGGAEISWTFICFQKTAKKRKIGPCVPHKGKIMVLLKRCF